MTKPKAAVTPIEAMSQATEDLRLRRALMTTAAYRQAWSARYAQIMGVDRVVEPVESERGMR